MTWTSVQGRNGAQLLHTAACPANVHYLHLLHLTTEPFALKRCHRSHACGQAWFASILRSTSPWVATQASSCWRPAQGASSAHGSPPRWSDIASSSGSRCVRLLIARSRRIHSACCASHRAMKLLLRWSCNCCMALQEYLLGLQGMAQLPAAEADAMLGMEKRILCLQRQAANMYHLKMSCMASRRPAHWKIVSLQAASAARQRSALQAACMQGSAVLQTHCPAAGSNLQMD